MPLRLQSKPSIDGELEEHIANANDKEDSLIPPEVIDIEFNEGIAGVEERGCPTPLTESLSLCGESNI